jgi:hypothetical protein
MGKKLVLNWFYGSEEKRIMKVVQKSEYGILPGIGKCLSNI